MKKSAKADSISKFGKIEYKKHGKKLYVTIDSMMYFNAVTQDRIVKTVQNQYPKVHEIYYYKKSQKNEVVTLNMKDLKVYTDFSSLYAASKPPKAPHGYYHHNKVSGYYNSMEGSCRYSGYVSRSGRVHGSSTIITPYGVTTIRF